MSGPRSQHTGASRGARPIAGPRALVIAVALLLPCATSRAQCLTGEWTLAGEPARRGHAMAYDSARGVTVMFGGVATDISGRSTDVDTWEWDGATWARRAIPGPSARSGHAMAYDSARGRIVLFGGRALSPTNPLLGDTWEFDGQTWTTLAVPGPAPREAPTLVYDSARGVCVLFGGRGDSGILADTWEWDGAEWRLRASTGPAARFGAMAAFDVLRGATLLFGGSGAGSSGSGVFGDTWQWDGQGWSLRSTSGPSPRAYGAMVFDTDSGRDVLVGGTDNLSLDFGDTWEWDGDEWLLATGDALTPRSGFAAAHDSARDAVVCFGGRPLPGFNSTLGDTWERHEGAWRRVAVTGPPTAPMSAAAYDPDTARVILFGGYPSDLVPPGASNATWALEGKTWRLLRTDGPPGRLRPSLAYDAGRHRLVLFGGVDETGNALGDTWEWEGTRWEQRATEGPAPRYLAGMAYHAGTQRIILYGGHAGGANVFYGDTWSWDGKAWTQLNVPSTGPRYGHALVYDDRRDRIVLFGGTGIGGADGSLWEWDGAQWLLRQQAGAVPGPTTGFGFAYDSDAEVSLLTTIGPNGLRVRAWNGTTWRLLGQSGPRFFSPQALLYNRARHEALLYYGSALKPDQWVWRFDSLVSGCAADLDCDNAITAPDLALLLATWGTNDPASDLNKDGVVNGGDLALLLGGWGACPD